MEKDHQGALSFFTSLMAGKIPLEKYESLIERTNTDDIKQYLKSVSPVQGVNIHAALEEIKQHRAILESTPAAIKLLTPTEITAQHIDTMAEQSGVPKPAVMRLISLLTTMEKNAPYLAQMMRDPTKMAEMMKRMAGGEAIIDETGVLNISK